MIILTKPSKALNECINRNPYTREWKQHTAVCLLALGMSEPMVIHAIAGNLDNKKEVKNVCIAELLPFNEVWALIK